MHRAGNGDALHLVNVAQAVKGDSFDAPGPGDFEFPPLFGEGTFFTKPMLIIVLGTALIGLLFWVGYRRATVSYPRQARKSGRSGWTLARRLRYAFDAAFAFSDLPITVMMTTGIVGIGTATAFGSLLLVARLTRAVDVPGYTALMLAVLFSFSTLLLGLGIIGGYVWRIYENTKGRPSYLVSSVEQIVPRVSTPAAQEHT